MDEFVAMLMNVVIFNERERARGCQEDWTLEETVGGGGACREVHARADHSSWSCRDCMCETRDGSRQQSSLLTPHTSAPSLCLHCRLCHTSVLSARSTVDTATVCVISYNADV